jgi:hypothetical protein
MKKKSLFYGFAGIIVSAMVLTGCASTPTTFEAAGSLAETTWQTFPVNGIYSALVINDTSSGVFTDGEGVETPFTYTAVYDAEKHSFTGTLTPAGGAEGDFSVTKGMGWNITAPGLGLNKENVLYLLPSGQWRR